MKIKVCGMKDPDNIAQVAGNKPDYMGFIFYEESKRDVGNLSPDEVIIQQGTEKVGVFVNQSLVFILKKAQRFGFDYIQLHGDESPAFCRLVKNAGKKVIKAFSVDANFDFSVLEAYKPMCDYFLFDAKGQGYGGNGVTFDWNVLQKYDNEKPIFLSGGINSSHADDLMKLNWLNIHAIDINSKFELTPGLKDVEKVRGFIQNIRDL
ncbi:MAG: phosphoribosylanthranilate isomerase [Cytophagaceae bacterium]